MMKITLSSVPIGDYDRALKFYTEILGFVEKMYMPEMNLAIVVSPEDTDGTTLLLEPRGGFGSDIFFDGVYEAKVPVIIFGTHDIQSDYERLVAKGVTFQGEPKKTDWGTQAIFDDTCGNFIQLHQP